MVSPSLPSDVVKTIEITKAAFEAAGVSDAWNRVCGVVVQPGVEFGDDQVFHYNSDGSGFKRRNNEARELIMKCIQRIINQSLDSNN